MNDYKVGDVIEAFYVASIYCTGKIVEFKFKGVLIRILEDMNYNDIICYPSNTQLFLLFENIIGFSQLIRKENIYERNLDPYL